MRVIAVNGVWFILDKFVGIDEMDSLGRAKMLDISYSKRLLIKLGGD
jgi:hypothetical protein